MNAIAAQQFGILRAVTVVGCRADHSVLAGRLRRVRRCRRRLAIAGLGRDRENPVAGRAGMLARLDRLAFREGALGARHGGCRVLPARHGWGRGVRNVLLNARDGVFPMLHDAGSRFASPRSFGHTADDLGFEHKLAFRHRRRPDELPGGRRSVAAESQEQHPKRKRQHKGAKQAHGNSVRSSRYHNDIGAGAEQPGEATSRRRPHAPGARPLRTECPESGLLPAGLSLDTIGS